MNYLYQLRGLLDLLGRRNADLSGEGNVGMDETLLSDGSPFGQLRYRLGWYAPKNTSYLKDVGSRGTQAL